MIKGIPIKYTDRKKVSIYFSHVNYKKVEKKISAKNDWNCMLNLRAKP